jgi:hypothetical protein
MKLNTCWLIVCVLLLSVVGQAQHGLLKNQAQRVPRQQGNAARSPSIDQPFG